MKWSEQMRVLQSEDEHYNQLMYDEDTYTLYLNKKPIGVLQPYTIDDKIDNGTIQVNIKALFYNDVIEIMKKYPFFTDIKFLLNCINKKEYDGTIEYSNPSSVEYQKVSEGAWLLIFMNTDEIIGIQV